MLNSTYAPLRTVVLPPPRGRQHYMHTFDLSHPTVPTGFEDYMFPVRQLVHAAGAGINNGGMAHLTIDEKVVKAGMSQRRPKPHVDGCFIPSQLVWGHEPGPGGWLHYCNNVGERIGRMPVIVAASEPGCRVWRGQFVGQPKNDGDLSHLEVQLAEAHSEIVPANWGYLLSADCVHESMIMDRDTPRTFIRIALPVGFAFDF